MSSKKKMVTVTLHLRVDNPRRLRQEVYRRCPEARGEGYPVHTLAQIMCDNADALGLDEAGLTILDSEADECEP